MNRYFIDYTDRNGSSYTTNQIAATEQAAREAFKKENPKDCIDHVSLVDSDIPATKDQERQAVEQIQGILRDLGPTSYVGAAMKGVLKIALENIEDDTACSMYDRMVYAQEVVGKAQQELADAQEEFKTLTDLNAALSQRLEALRENMAHNNKAYDELVDDHGELQEERDALRLEVQALKAKLYDLTIGGGQDAY